TAGRVYVFDLHHPEADPAQLGTGSHPSIDGALAAWVGDDRAVRVATLPFAVTSPPRLLDGGGVPAFSPNGDGHLDTWSAVWDTTRPLSSWTVTLTNSAGAAVRHWTGGPAEYGAVRLAWDGRNDADSPLPDGTYTWSFTGTATDGSGSVLRPDGSAQPLTGTVV